MSTSVFASRVTKVVPVGEHSVTIRKLNPRQMGAAQRAMQLQSLDDLKAFGGPAFIKEIQGMTADQKQAEQAQAQAERQKNPLVGFDRDTLLTKGIVAWTFTEEDGQTAPLDAAHIEDLDDETGELIATEILKLAKPALFADAAEVQKNG